MLPMTTSSNIAQRLTDHQQELANQLTHLQRATVINVVAGMPRAEAYWQAGGKAKTKISAENVVMKMFKYISVRNFYDSLMLASTSSAVMTREQALERLTHLAEDDEDKRLSKDAIKLLAELEGWEAPKKVDARVMYTQIERRVIDDTDD